MKRQPVWTAGTATAWMKIPKHVRIYDNGGSSVLGGTVDRYTVVFTGRYRGKGYFQYVGMSGAPRHPQGFCQHGEHRTQIDVNRWGWAPAMGRRCHLGKRIPFEQLPIDCQRVVKIDYHKIWN